MVEESQNAKKKPNHRSKRWPTKVEHIETEIWCNQARANECFYKQQLEFMERQVYVMSAVQQQDCSFFEVLAKETQWRNESRAAVSLNEQEEGETIVGESFIN